MGRRDIDIKHEVRVRERILQLFIEEGLDPRPERVPHGEEEVEMVLITLAHAQEDSVAHEAPELERRVEVDVFAKNEVVGDFGGR